MTQDRVVERLEVEPIAVARFEVAPQRLDDAGRAEGSGEEG